MLELKIIQLSTEMVRAGVGDHGRITFFSGTGSPAPDKPKITEVLGDPRDESPVPREGGDTSIHTRTLVEFLSAHFQTKWTEKTEGGSIPPDYIHPPRDLVKGRQGNWRSGLKDLIRWISWGHF
jgi:hypothetical protein